jgi:hypothetical protein
MFLLLAPLELHERQKAIIRAVPALGLQLEEYEIRKYVTIPVDVCGENSIRLTNADIISFY